jgi:hypothetical protein
MCLLSLSLIEGGDGEECGKGGGWGGVGELVRLEQLLSVSVVPTPQSPLSLHVDRVDHHYHSTLQCFCYLLFFSAAPFSSWLHRPLTQL